MSRLRADRRVGLLLAGVLLLTFVAIGATIALPASDPSLSGKPTKLSSTELRGMTVYRTEGCWYCHTQYARNTRMDGGLTARKARDYSGLSPAMLGFERIGLDLTRGDPEAPKSELIKGFKTPHGSMPSYAFLSDRDLDALAAYLLSLR